MKIVCLLEKLDILQGGLGQFFYYISKHHVRLGHTVYIYCFGNPADNCERNGIRIHHVLKPKFVRIFGGSALLSAVNREAIHPDIIHGPQTIPWGWLFGYNKPLVNCKYILSVHSGIDSLNKLRVEGLKSMIQSLEYSYLQSFIAQKVDHVLPVAQFIKDELIKLGVDENKITVIPPGVDLSKFKPREKHREKSSFDVYYFGRAVRRKGIRYFLQAAYILKNYTDIHFHLVGITPSDEEYKDIINTLKGNQLSSKVKIHKFIPHNLIHKEYQKADVVILPSLFEPFARTNLEALATGVPLIATAMGGVMDLVQNEINGLLIPPKNARAIAGAILKLRKDNNLREKLIKNGLQSVKKYDWQNIVSQYLQVFKTVLSKS